MHKALQAIDGNFFTLRPEHRGVIQTVKTSQLCDFEKPCLKVRSLCHKAFPITKNNFFTLRVEHRGDSKNRTEVFLSP